MRRDRKDAEKGFLYKANASTGRAFWAAEARGRGITPNPSVVCRCHLATHMASHLRPNCRIVISLLGDGEAGGDPWMDRVRRDRQGPVLHRENANEKVRQAKPERARSASVGHEIQRPHGGVRLASGFPGGGQCGTGSRVRSALLQENNGVAVYRAA